MEPTGNQQNGMSANRETARGRLVFWATALAMSVQFAEAYARTLPLLMPMADWAHGQVESPFRRRVLTQWIYRAVLHVFGNRSYRGAHAVISIQTMIDMGLAFVSVLAVIALCRAAIVYFVRQQQLRWLSLLAVYMLIFLQLMPSDIRGQMPYDLPAAMFFGLGTYGALTRNRWIYYPALLLGTLNKESTVFLVPMLFLASLEEAVTLPNAIRSAKVWMWLEAGCALLGWKLLVQWCEHLTGGHGQGMFVAISQNVHLLRNPRHWITAMSVWGFLWLPCAVYFRRVASVRVRRVALLLLPWFAVLFCFGDVIEVRTHGEWVVFMVLMVTMVVDASVRFVAEGERPVPAATLA